jgi:poly(3-hydroxybutyrate) depolymerase
MPATTPASITRPLPLRGIALAFCSMLVLLLFAQKGCGGAYLGEGGGDDALSQPGGAERIRNPVAYKGAFPAGKGSLSAKLTVGGLARDVKLYLPARRGKAPPLLVAFHGTNGEPEEAIRNSGARELADSVGIVVAAPQARYQQKGDWDNHGGSETYWTTYPEVDPDKNPDLLLVRAIVEEAQRAYGIDTSRVYLLGHSSGGFFSILAGVALSDLVAAFAANSSGLVRCEKTGSCLFRGGARSCAALSSKAGWCRCSGAEKPVAIPAAAPGRKLAAYLTHSNDDDKVSVYYSCDLAAALAAKGHEVEVHLRAGTGHDLPMDLAKQAWRFFKTHVRR